MMKKMFALVVFCMLGIFGCGGGGGGGGSGSGSVGSAVDKPLSIKVTPSDNVLVVGLQKQFTATGIYSDGKEKDLTTEVTWSSSNAGAAAVSNDQSSKGMVTVLGHSAQGIVITAALDGISGKTNLSVPAISLVSIAVTPGNTTMAAGTSYNYKATGTYSDSTSSVITGAVQWSSSQPSVATVAGLGKVTGVAAGTTTLTATLGSIAGSSNLTVTSAALQSISITPDNTNLAVGTGSQFHATGFFSDNTSQDLTTAVVWSSSASAIAAITAEGMVTAVSAGNATISAFYKNIPSDITVSTGLTVSNVELRTISITPEIGNLTAGSTKQLKVIGAYSNGTTQDLTGSVTWESSDPTIAGVDENNRLLASKVGSTTIKATLGGVTASAGTTITPADVSGTWTGTYTIYDDPADPSQIGTYNFSLVLNQSGGVLSGTTTLRESRADAAVSNLLTGNIWDRRIDFRFTYFSPFFSRLMENLGKLEITDGTMRGNAVENYNSGYNCSYVISVTKQP
ncbi:Ig-like domain-containing protein [Pelotalea chapellei]|uniref:Ig-like domain-containing protein n=1 Tax=Pelotalea chapellei TaxID=44671 RepID=A0ABS5U6G4_9BACT|nr:Ig-like domain-containing protein [Pelotalea chapellei]MBT1071264.1 Ig-like domain-containing protein [Pelotalea chapellei]